MSATAYSLFALDTIAEFAAALDSAGIPCPDPIKVDEQFHRYRVHGNECWYSLRPDATGCFGCFSLTIARAWRSEYQALKAEARRVERELMQRTGGHL